MEVDPARPQQTTRVRTHKLFLLLILVAVLTLIGVGLVLAGPAYAVHAAS